MKVRVIEKFLDKYTNELRNVGEELEVNSKRAKELMGGNKLKIVFVEEIVKD